MRSYAKKRQTRERVASIQDSWIRGLNLLTSQTEIRPNELSNAVDIQLVENGKVQCPRDGQSYYGESNGSKVTGIFPYYKSDGTNKLLRMVGTTLQEYNGTGWDNVTGMAYTTGLDTQAVMAYDRLYLANGTDVLSYYDGSSITAFVEISAPGAPTVTRTGTTGSYTYSYKVTAVTAVGETPPSTAGSEVANVAVLDSSTYMTVSWSAVTDAIGYNLYGRKDGKWYFMTYLEGNGSTSYVDKGALTPQELFTPPEGNTTGGARGKYIAVYKDTLCMLGDPDNPSRLYYTAGGDLINDFSVGSGGGFIDIAKNDGAKGTGLIQYKNSLVCFKENAIYQFGFETSGLPSITQITAAVGCVAPRSIVAVENDIFFYAGERGIFSIGNQEGFAFDVLRTNEISTKVRSIIQTIEPSRKTNVAAIYSTVANHNLVIFSYTVTGGTTNSRALVYDRERYAWYEWTNINANCWTAYRDSNGAMHSLYGDDSSGYVKEIMSGSDDFGSGVDGTFSLSGVSFKAPATYKKLKKMDLILREPTGYIQLSIIKDGVSEVLTVPIGTISPTVNWGHYVFSEFLLGVSSGTGISTQDQNLLRTSKNMNIEGRYYTLKFTNLSGSFVLLHAGLEAKLRSPNHRKAGEIIEY
jgi:hypothetical protein